MPHQGWRRKGGALGEEVIVCVNPAMAGFGRIIPSLLVTGNNRIMRDLSPTRNHGVMNNASFPKTQLDSSLHLSVKLHVPCRAPARRRQPPSRGATHVAKATVTPSSARQAYPTGSTRPGAAAHGQARAKAVSSREGALTLPSPTRAPEVHSCRVGAATTNVVTTSATARQGQRPALLFEASGASKPAAPTHGPSPRAASVSAVSFEIRAIQRGCRCRQSRHGEDHRWPRRRDRDGRLDVQLQIAQRPRGEPAGDPSPGHGLSLEHRRVVLGLIGFDKLELRAGSHFHGQPQHLGPSARVPTPSHDAPCHT
jgi:hypothetical protein